MRRARCLLTNYNLRRSTSIANYCKPPPGLVRYVKVDVHKYDVNAPLSPAVLGVTVPLAVPRDWVVHFRKRQATPLASTR
jgi:hypothetical protein